MSGFPTINNFDLLVKYCEILAQSPTYAKMGGMPGIMAVILTAQEQGIGPMAALNGALHLITTNDKAGNLKSSKITTSYLILLSKIRKAGHKVEEINSTDQSVTLKGTRTDTGEAMTVTCTLKKASEAGLIHYPNGNLKSDSAWVKDPENMLWKSCVVKLSKRLFSDVVSVCGGVEEDSSDEENQDFEMIELNNHEFNKKNEIETENKTIHLIEDQKNQYLLNLKDFKSKYNLNDENSFEREYINNIISKKNENMKYEYMTLEKCIDWCMSNEDVFVNELNKWKNKKSSAKDEMDN